MRQDYKIQGATTKVELEVEQTVAEILTKMELYSKIPRSELANTALKRFIASHKDFLPPVEHK